MSEPLYTVCKASHVRLGDTLLEPDMRVAEISHGPLNRQIRFRNADDTATVFRFDDEFVAIAREVRS